VTTPASCCDTTLQDTSADQATTEITGHLLDRVLPAANAHRPGQPPPPYDLQNAQNALAKIAARMNQDGTRDLQWWRIPAWTPRAPRVVVAGLTVGLVVGLAGVLVYGLVDGLEGGLVVGLLAGLVVGLGLLGGSEPHRLGKLRLRRALSQDALLAALASGLVAGLAFVFVVGLVYGLVIAFVVGLVFGLLGGLAAGLVVGLPDPDSTSSPSPTLSRLDDRRYAFVVGLALALQNGLMVGLTGRLVIGFEGGLVVGPAAALAFAGAGLAFGLVAGTASSTVWHASLAAAQLARHWHTPLHLMRFLEDARERNVLRTVGPVYQFRHARLQDRLAAATTDRAAPQAAGRPTSTPAAAADHGH
jgi:hypothetical protein